MTAYPLRGQVWFARLDHIDPDMDKPFVIVSNNHRNRLLDEVLGVRVTTTRKYGHYDSLVSLLHGEPVVGTVLCDDIEIIYKDQLRKCGGGLTPPALAAVSDGLRAALGLSY